MLLGGCQKTNAHRFQATFPLIAGDSNPHHRFQTRCHNMGRRDSQTEGMAVHCTYTLGSDVSQINPPTLIHEKPSWSSMPSDFCWLYWIECPHKYRNRAGNAEMPICSIESEAVNQAWPRAFLNWQRQRPKHEQIGHLFVFLLCRGPELCAMFGEMERPFHGVLERH